MALKIYTAPAVEPISLAEAKLHLRVDIDDDDSYISALITAARQAAEATTNRAFITQTWDLFADRFTALDRIMVPLPPLQSVTGIYYTPYGGVETTLTIAHYSVDTSSDPGRVVLNFGYCWPGSTLIPVNGMRMRFVAGYGAAGSNVPQSIRQAMLLMIGHYYENREATGKPVAVDSLLWPYRVMEF